ncbi:MAG: PEGA domain-containing protein [Myxococcaceae bacterium]|nr:PEGA domain-containing protein [Myxococcaceae bacterium]
MLTLLLVVLAAPAKGAPASSAPSLPSRASVFVVPQETAEASAAKVEVRLTKALEERSVALTDLESLFPADVAVNKAAALIKEGTDGVDNLDFDGARAKFTEAMEFLNQNAGAADAKDVATVHLHLANIALQTGGKPGQKTALDEVMKAYALFPALELDPKYFGPDVKKVADKALVELNKAPKATLTISTSPLGAEVSVRGAALGVSPLAEAPIVPAGRHLVTVKRAGFKPAGAFVSVPKEGTQVTIDLAEAEGYGQARSSMKSLVPANLGKGVPREARPVAETMKSRFLIVAEVAPGGDGKLEVWDVETRARLQDVALPTDENFGPVVDKVKAFLANPSPVVATRATETTVTTTAEPSSGDSVFSKWWFWAAVGGVVVVGATATAVGVAASQPQPPSRPSFNPALFPL